MKISLRLLVTLWIVFASGIALAEPLTLGITPATARNQYALMEEWRDYLQHKMNRPVEIVLRDSFHDSMDLMKQGKLDFAWFSASAYIENSRHLHLLASPVYRGRLFDRAYLIAPASDHSSQALLDFENKVFAYVEPDSTTGHLVTRYQLRLDGKEPEHFFKKSFFTHDHLKVIAAVAIGLADGGSMSGFAWETLALTRPDITSQTRIVAKSRNYGFPPIVARGTLNRQDSQLMQRTLLGMSNDADGIKLLKRLNLDGFARTDENNYRDVERMMRRMGDL